MTTQERWAEAMAWLERADALNAADTPERAEGALERALELLARIDDPLLEGNTWLTLGRHRFDRGDPDRAIEAIRRASACFEAGGLDYAQSRATLFMGEVLLWRGEWREAEAALIEATRRIPLTGSRVGEALAWCWLGEARAGQQNHAGAKEALERATALAVRCGAIGIEARAWRGLSGVALQTGGIGEALKHARTAADSSEAIEDRVGVGWALLNEAEAVRATGQLGTAWWTTRKARAFFQRERCIEGLEAARGQQLRWPWWRVAWLELSRRLRRKPRALPGVPGNPGLT